MKLNPDSMISFCPAVPEEENNLEEIHASPTVKLRPLNINENNKRKANQGTAGYLH